MKKLWMAALGIFLAVGLNSLSGRGSGREREYAGGFPGRAGCAGERHGAQRCDYDWHQL